MSRKQVVEMVYDKTVWLCHRWVEHFLDKDTGNRISINRHSPIKELPKHYWIYN